MARHGWDEVRKGFDKWFKFACNMGVLWIILDILPHLPEELGKKIADKLLAMIGL